VLWIATSFWSRQASAFSAEQALLLRFLGHGAADWRAAVSNRLGHSPLVRRKLRLFVWLPPVEDRAGERQPTCHDVHRLDVVVDERAMTAEAHGRLPGGSTTSEEVENLVARAGVDLHDPVQDPERLLRRVASPLLPVRGDDCVPPNVSWRLAPGGLLLSNKPRGHVGDAVHLVEVERVVLRVLDVPEDVIVLGGPLLLGACAVVVSPDDLVDERVPPEQLVEEDLAVVDLPIVDVKEERPTRLEEATGLLKPRLHELEEVLELVGEAGRSDLDGAVPLPLEPGAVPTVLIPNGSDTGALLHLARVEGRVDVDHVEAGGRHLLED